MTEYEIKVLKDFAGDTQDDLCHCKEIGEAIAKLKALGYIKGTYALYITREGRDYLDELL